MLKRRPTLSPTLVFNTRSLQTAQSGVPRYTKELDRRWDAQVERRRPARAAQGIQGHLWEQLVLPRQLHGRLLFSPGNTGPLAHRRQIVTIHDASTFDQPEAFTGIFAHWYRWLLPRLARRALGIVTVSRFSRDRICARLGVPPERVSVIYNGVTLPEPRSTAEQEKEYERLDLPRRFLLFVGSQDPRKNVARLLDGFARANLGEVELILAGGADPRLFSAGSSNIVIPRVRSLGRVSDAALDALYARAEGFVFPSLYEGFGLPPLEAMARGCPVLSSDASCLPEVCGAPVEKGGACFYFSPHSTEAITAALEQFCALPLAAKRAMADAGRRRAAQFSWDRCAQETLALLHNHSGLRSPASETAAASQPQLEANPA